MNSRARGVRGNFKKGLSSSQCTQGQWQRNRVSRVSFQPSEERTANCSSDLAMIRTTSKENDTRWEANAPRESLIPVTKTTAAQTSYSAPASLCVLLHPNTQR